MHLAWQYRWVVPDIQHSAGWTASRQTVTTSEITLPNVALSYAYRAHPHALIITMATPLITNTVFTHKYVIIVRSYIIVKSVMKNKKAPCIHMALLTGYLRLGSVVTVRVLSSSSSTAFHPTPIHRKSRIYQRGIGIINIIALQAVMKNSRQVLQMQNFTRKVRARERKGGVIGTLQAMSWFTFCRAAHKPILITPRARRARCRRGSKRCPSMCCTLAGIYDMHVSEVWRASVAY